MPRIVSLAILLLSALAAGVPRAQADARVRAFDCGWYATRAVAGRQAHWNHGILGVEDGGRHPGDRDIGADFYPVGGPCSANDPAVAARHVRRLRDAGIGVIAITSFDEWRKGMPNEPAAPLVMDDPVFPDDRPREPDHDLRRTRHWIDHWAKGRD